MCVLRHIGMGMKHACDAPCQQNRKNKGTGAQAFVICRMCCHGLMHDSAYAQHAPSFSDYSPNYLNRGLNRLPASLLSEKHPWASSSWVDQNKIQFLVCLADRYKRTPLIVVFLADDVNKTPWPLALPPSSATPYELYRGPYCDSVKNFPPGQN